MWWWPYAIAAAAVAYMATRTRDEYRVPVRQSWTLRLLNSILKPSCWLADVGICVPRVGKMLKWPLSLPALMAEAERRTKLDDWARDASFPVLYEIAVARLNETTPTPVGRLIAFDYLLRRLVTRLQVVRRAQDAPDPRFVPRAPIVVMGLPRTGTTFLHRLLALDPATRCPETHELLDPLSERPLDKRVAYWDAKLHLMKRLVPHLEQIHELGAREAEECLLALSVDVPLLPPTFRHLVRHCVQGDHVTFPPLKRAYSLYKRQLEFLAARRGTNERWALKCPIHLPYVSDLLNEFPDARMVWTHRDPCEALPSLCSMFRTFADMGEAGPVDLEAIGREQLAFWLASADRALNVKDACCHVAYADLVRDPRAAVRRVYAAFGLEVSPAFDRAMEEHLAGVHTKRRFHTYSLGEYGLVQGDVRVAFGRYLAAVPVEFELSTGWPEERGRVVTDW